MNRIIFFFAALLFLNNLLFGQVSQITSFPKDTLLKNGAGGKVAAVGKHYYFTASTKSNGEELWITDGTAAGTHMVKDIRPGTTSTEFGNFTAFKGKLYFFANNGANGFELWKSDGTAAGTTIVKDINPAGGIISGISASQLYADGDYLYFGALLPGFGEEVWVTDGTATGTKILKDINPGSASSSPSRFFTFNQKVYFFAKSDIFAGSELWETTGTPASTKQVLLLNENGNTSNCTALSVNSTGFYFTMTQGFGDQLWKSDGTKENTRFIVNLNQRTRELVLLDNNRAVFTLEGGNNQDDIWTTDGTQSGTKVLKDLNNSNKTTPHSLIKWKDQAYLLANEMEDVLLIKSDGSQQGTTIVEKFALSASSGNIFLTPFTKEFIAVSYKDQQTSTEIYTSKGTPESTALLVNLNKTEGESSKPADFGELENGTIIFKAEQTKEDRQLFLYNTYVPLAIDISMVSSIECYGDTTGILKVIVAGGQPPYNYLWSQGSIIENAASLKAGTYTVTVTDYFSNTATAIFTLNQPDSLIVNSIIKPENQGMKNGEIVLTISGGTEPYTYQWTHGSVEKSPAELSAGNYSVTITDGNGCLNYFSFEVSLISNTSQENPCKTEIQATSEEFTLIFCEPGMLYLRDIAGREITSKKVNQPIVQLDVINLKTGIYVLTFVSENNAEVFTRKILKP